MDFKVVSLDGDWFYLNVEMYHSKVLVFVGSRAEWASIGADALRERFGLGDEEAKDIVSYIKTFCEGRSDGQSIDGDAIGYDGVSLIRVNSMVTGNMQDILRFNHECLHVAYRILKYVGIEETYNNEAICYLHEYIFGKLMEQMLEKGVGRRLDVDEVDERRKVTEQIRRNAELLISRICSMPRIDKDLETYTRNILDLVTKKKDGEGEGR